MPRHAQHGPGPRWSERLAPIGRGAGQWWNRVTKTIITLGAVAAAVAALIALWPSRGHDHEDRAIFRSVQVTAGVPLNEFVQRIPASGGEHSVRTARSSLIPLVNSFARSDLAVTGATSVPPSQGQSPLPEEPSSPGPSEPSAQPCTSQSCILTGTGVSGTPTGTATGSLSIPPSVATDRPGLANAAVNPYVPPGWSAQGWSVRRDASLKELSRLAVGADRWRFRCPPSTVSADCDVPLRTVLVTSVTNSGPGGTVVSPAQAARNLVHVFAHGRTITDSVNRVRHPVGVVVTIRVELDGLRGKHVALQWQLWPVDGKSALFAPWLSPRSGPVFTATTDADGAGYSFWIPLPKQRGLYAIHLALLLGNSDLDEVQSTSFK